MKIKKNIENSNTLDEARFLTYKRRLQSAIKMFNESGISGEDIEKAWIKQYQDGFEECLHIVSNVFSKYKTQIFDNIWMDIEREVNKVK